MGTWKHRISNVNPETKTGTCTNCGEVDLYFIPGTERWQCRIAKRDKRNRYRSKKIHGKKAAWINSRVVRIEMQDGLCPICGGKAEVLDHCHNSGELRDALCSACNKGLGFFKDDPKIVLKAAEYLYYHHKRNGIVLGYK